MLTAGPGGDGLTGFWAAVGDALLMFPLTRAVRESLVQLACASMAQHSGSAAAALRGRWGLASRPEEGALITGAPVVGILLQLLLGCDEAQERGATLEALHSLIGELGFSAACVPWLLVQRPCPCSYQVSFWPPILCCADETPVEDCI